MQLVTRKTLTIPLHTNLQTLHNRQVQSFRAMLKVFLLITELLMSSILISFFPAVLRTSQYLLLRLGSRGHETMREHFTLPGTIICANFSFTCVDLTLANVLEDRTFDVRFRISQQFQYYTLTANDGPTSEILSAFVAV